MELDTKGSKAQTVPSDDKSTDYWSHTEYGLVVFFIILWKHDTHMLHIFIICRPRPLLSHFPKSWIRFPSKHTVLSYFYFTLISPAPMDIGMVVIHLRHEEPTSSHTAKGKRH